MCVDSLHKNIFHIKTYMKSSSQGVLSVLKRRKIGIYQQYNRDKSKDKKVIGKKSVIRNRCNLNKLYMLLMRGTTYAALELSRLHSRQCQHVEVAAQEAGQVGNKLRSLLLSPKMQS